MQLGTGQKWSPLIAFATGIPYSLRERMGEKQPQGKESHQRGEQEVSEAETHDQTKHTDEERWCAVRHTALYCKQDTDSKVYPDVKTS